MTTSCFRFILDIIYGAIVQPYTRESRLTKDLADSTPQIEKLFSTRGYSSKKHTVAIDFTEREIKRFKRQPRSDSGISPEQFQKNERVPNPLFDKQGPHNLEEQQRAAEAIQRVWKMCRTRSRVIFPMEFLSFLKGDLLGMNTTELVATAKIIARESIKMLEAPQSYRGEGVRLAKLKEKYRDGSAHVHTLPRTVWIQLGEDGKTVRIQFYGKHYKSGTYKDVKESETIVITLSNGSNKPKRREDTVLVRTRDTQEDKSGKRATQAEIRESQEDDLEMVNNGIQTIKHLFPPEELERDSNLKFCGIPKTIRKHQGKNRKKFEWEEVRFSNDFSEVCKTGQVKCDTAGTIVTEFRTNDKFRIAEFLTYTVEQIHLKGKVHRDVKPINILVHYNEARQCPEGFLTDYDLITDFGSNETKSEYEYWDLCSEKGFVLPTADIFGVAMCLGSSIFGAKYPEILSSARHHYDIREIESTINEFHGKYINLKIVPLYKDINTSSLLRKQLRDYLQWVSNRAIRDGRPVPDIDEIKEVLDSIIKANPEKETSILTILADCYAAQELSQLLFEIHKADLDLFTFIMKDPKGKDLALALGNESVSLEDKLEMIQALYVKFPIFKEFRGRLKNIRTNWEH